MTKRQDDDTENCSSCRHWREDLDPGDTRAGECRANPPQLLHEPDTGSFSLWPMTAATDECGAYKRKVQ